MSFESAATSPVAITGTPPLKPKSMRKRKGASASGADEAALTSIRIFRKFIIINSDGTLDASGVVSPECYRAWLDSRKQSALHPERSFQRALTGHITGMDGRTPFEPTEEKAILEILRRKERWPCFQNSSTKFGQIGFRTLGFHERSSVDGSVPPEVTKQSPTKSKKSRKAKSDEEDDEDEEEEEDSKDETSEIATSEPNPSVVVMETSPGSSFTVHESEPNPSEDEEEWNANVLNTVKRVRTGPRSSKEPRVDEPKPEKQKAKPQKGSTKRSSSNVSDELQSAGTVLPALQQNSSSSGFSTPSAPLLDTPFPQPPIVNAGGRTGNVNSLMDGFKSVIRSIYDLSHMWTAAYGFARMKLLTRGWLSSPTMEQAQEVMRRVKQAHPDNYVILFDLMAQTYSDRVILQDDLSVQYFGGISRHHGGFVGARFLPEDTFRIFKIVSQCYTYPGHEFPVQLRWKLGVVGTANYNENCRTAWFDSYYHVDEPNHLLVERGTISKSPPGAQ